MTDKKLATNASGAMWWPNCIYSGRKRSVLPSIKFFVALVRDELKLKYAGNRILKYADSHTERKAVNWLRHQMGWTTSRMTGFPLMETQNSEI